MDSKYEDAEKRKEHSTNDNGGIKYEWDHILIAYIEKIPASSI